MWLSLLWGATAVFDYSMARWRMVLMTNFVAVGGVLLGIAALAAGRLVQLERDRRRATRSAVPRAWKKLERRGLRAWG